MRVDHNLEVAKHSDNHLAQVTKKNADRFEPVPFVRLLGIALLMMKSPCDLAILQDHYRVSAVTFEVLRGGFNLAVRDKRCYRCAHCPRLRLQSSRPYCRSQRRTVCAACYGANAAGV